jgi:hypothetical protein
MLNVGFKGKQSQQQEQYDEGDRKRLTVIIVHREALLFAAA